MLSMWSAADDHVLTNNNAACLGRVAGLLSLAPVEAPGRHHGLLEVVLRVQVHHVGQVVLRGWAEGP